MNLLYTFDKELKGKHFTEDEKLRYIYLRFCEIFSFDARWYYANFIKDYETARKIERKDINLKHMDDNLIICHTVVKPLKSIIETFTCRQVEIYTSLSHSYIFVDFLGNKYKLDLTGMNDLAYVKMGLETKGFRIDGYINPNFKEMDKSLGFDLYTDSEYILNLDINPKLSLFDKCMKISNMLYKSINKYTFSDAKLCVYRIEDFLRINLVRQTDTFITKQYEFHNLTNLSNRFLELSKVDGIYNLHEIDEEKYLSLKTCLYRRR